MLERFAEERLCGDRLDAGVERGEAQFLQRLVPPIRHQSPTHLHQLAVAFVRDDGIHWVGRADVEAGLHIGNRRRNGQPIQLLDLLPRVVLGRTSAHSNVPTAPSF